MQNSLLTGYEAIGWIAAILVAIVGLPQLVFVLRTKKVEKPHLYSWFIFSFAVYFFSIWGLMIANLQLIVAETIAMFITAATVSGFVQYRVDKQVSKNMKILQHATVWSIFLLIIVNDVLYGINVGGVEFNTQATGVLGNIFSFLGPITSTVAFLPQTIVGIRKKSLHYIPAFFMIDLWMFNLFWIIAFGLMLGAIDSGYVPVFLTSGSDAYNLWKLSYIFGITFQSIQFVIASVQASFWYIQVREVKRIIWI